MFKTGRRSRVGGRVRFKTGRGSRVGGRVRYKVDRGSIHKVGRSRRWERGAGRWTGGWGKEGGQVLGW